MVPRLAITSSRVMPMPLSVMVTVPAARRRRRCGSRARGPRPAARAVRERREAQPVAGIRGVGDQLAQEDLPVAVERVDHELEELAHLGLEAVGFAAAARFSGVARVSSCHGSPVRGLKSARRGSAILGICAGFSSAACSAAPVSGKGPELGEQERRPLVGDQHRAAPPRRAAMNGAASGAASRAAAQVARWRQAHSTSSSSSQGAGRFLPSRPATLRQARRALACARSQSRRGLHRTSAVRRLGCDPRHAARDIARQPCSASSS